MPQKCVRQQRKQGFAGLEPRWVVRRTWNVIRLIAASSGLLIAALLLVESAGATDVWRQLHRPLHLPRLAAGTACPVSSVDRRVAWKRINIFGGSGIGPGPVYPGLGGSGGRVTVTPDAQHGGPWLGTKVFWYVRPTYRGPVLIRGRQLDGPYTLGFNGGRVPQSELRIHTYDSVGWSGQPPGSRGVPSAIRVLAPGCYGVQIDGTRFSRRVVFDVTS